jgi:hypothetical protein
LKATLVARPPDAAGRALRAENKLRLVPGLRKGHCWVPTGWGSHSDEAQHRLVTTLQEALAEFGALPYPVAVLRQRLRRAITCRRTYARYCISEYQKENIPTEGAGTRAPGRALLLLARRPSRLLTTACPRCRERRQPAGGRAWRRRHRCVHLNTTRSTLLPPVAHDGRGALQRVRVYRVPLN